MAQSLMEPMDRWLRRALRAGALTYREADLMQQWSLLIEECEKLSVPEPLFLAADKLALYQLPTSRRM